MRHQYLNKYNFVNVLIKHNFKIGLSEALNKSKPLKYYVRFEAFMAFKCNEVFLGDQPCNYGITIQCFGD